jgi:hypothetical protein
MSKFLLNLHVQIFKALVNSKIQFSIQNFFFFAFGLADLAAHSASGPAGPHWPLFSRRPSILGAFSLSTTDAWAPLVRPVFSTASADPGRESSAPPLPASPVPRLGCRQVFTAPSSFPPLTPFKPSLNGLNGYSSPSLLRPPPPPPAPSPGPIKATPMTPGAPHTSPSLSLLGPVHHAWTLSTTLSIEK